jgi:predicted ArsR family transcriptional regulator
MSNRSPNPASLPSTREKILTYLQEQRLATVETLSRQYGLTRADIRYHLNVLMTEGVIEIACRDVSQPTGRGRPKQFFRLAVGETPDNLPNLCSALLVALRAASPDPWAELAVRLVELMPGGQHLADSTVQRFNAAVERLSQHGYQARWEAHAAGPRILLRNCPYAAVLPDHPELCEMDRVLLSYLTKLPQQQITRINLLGGKPPACIFASLHPVVAATESGR